MNNDILNESISFLFGFMTDTERDAFIKKFDTLSDSDKKEFEALRNTTASLPLSLKHIQAPERIKARLFNSINNEQTNVISLPESKSKLNYFLVAASILITFLATRYYYSVNLEDNSFYSNSLAIKTSLTQDEEQEKMSTALCLIAKGTNMSHQDANGVMHYGKKFYNKISKSSVIHMCFLPKHENKFYTLWIQEENGKYSELAVFDATNKIQELNYLIKREFLSDNHKLMVTLENTNHPQLPSNNVMLANL